MSERIVKIKLQADATGMVQGLGRARDAVAETKTKMEESARSSLQEWSEVGAGLTAVGVAITGVGVAALTTGIQYNTLQQTTRAALTTLLGSASAANAQMDKLDDFARNSPFSKSTFISAQQQMLGFGVAAKDVVPALDAIQNAVASMGGSNEQISAISEIMSRIKSESRLSGDALQRLGYYGIDAAAIIGSQMGKTAAEIRDMARKPGGIPVEQVWDPLVTGLQEKFGGAADNVKNTFAGSLDRVKAAWRDFSSELAKPLVDPNGGGALVDLLNWTADAMRNFQKLPEPIKATTSAVTGLVGTGALLAGAAMLALPKWVAFKDALATFPSLSGRVKGGFKDLWSFLTGPWGIALVAAATAMHVLNQQIQAGVPTQAELKNALLTTADAADVLAKAGARSGTEKFFMGDYAEQLKDLSGLFERTGEVANNFFSHALAGTQNKDIGSLGVLEDMGKALSDIASTDLPAAQKAFSNLAESQSLTAAETAKLLDRMPEFKDALVEQATAIGESASDSNLLKLAMGELSPATQSAAEAYTDAASSASELNDQLLKLIDVISELNGIGQAAEQTNSKVQTSFAKLQDYVANAQAGVEGYSLSLDESTAAGASNRAMLAAHAADLESDARAQFELESKTIGATAAAQNFESRLSSGRQQIFDTALALSGSADEAQKLTDKVLAVPDSKEIDVLLRGAAEAGAQVDELSRKLALIPSVVTTEIRKFESTIYSEEGLRKKYGKAHGGTVGFAAGGTVGGVGGGVFNGTVYGRGGSKSDSINVDLSRGEEVIQEPYASMYRRELKQMNRGDFVSGSQSQQRVVIVREIGDVYVQNPVTGKYLLSQMDAVANNAIDGFVEQQAQENRRAGL